MIKADYMQMITFLYQYRQLCCQYIIYIHTYIKREWIFSENNFFIRLTINSLLIVLLFDALFYSYTHKYLRTIYEYESYMYLY